MKTPRGFFQDSSGDLSMSRLNQFLIVVGGLVLSGLALYYDRAGAELIFGGAATASGAVAWKSKDAESKENIVDKAQPVDGSVEVKA